MSNQSKPVSKDNFTYTSKVSQVDNLHVKTFDASKQVEFVPYMTIEGIDNIGNMMIQFTREMSKP